MLPLLGMMGGSGGMSASATATSGVHAGPVGFTTTGPDQSGFVINYGAASSVGSGGVPLLWLGLAGLAWLLLRR